MDLLQSVRKEGSRGGVNFSWDQVKSSNHRENYLGHSLMAPVGRWAKNKDLSWYAKADDTELKPEERAAKEAERKAEEKRKVKEAEEVAMARALGLTVPGSGNANHEPLGESKISQKHVHKALKEALGDEEEGADRTAALGSREKKETGNLQHWSREHRRRDRSRSKSRSRDRHRYRDDKDHRRRRRSRSRSRDHDKRRDRHRHRHRSRDRSGDRHRTRARDRTRSPYDSRRRRRDDSR